MSNGPSRARVCEHCLSAQLAWDAKEGRLRCQGCGSLQEKSDSDAGIIVEHDLNDALKRRRVRGPIGQGTRLLRCETCRAEIEIPDEISATHCEFCRSPLVIPLHDTEDHNHPESLIPFAIDRASAERAFSKWLQSLWLRPRSLRTGASLRQLHGVYIPYWAFGCEVTTRWSADSGYTHYEVVSRQTPRGEEKSRVAHTRWQPSSGSRHDRYTDHLVCASRGLASELHGDIHRFDTRGLLPYSNEYVLGFSAERYAVELREAWQQARSEIGSEQSSRCLQDIPGDTQRDVRTTHQFQAVQFKYVLLPMWIAAYEYQGKVHRFLVNGQTGEVEGTAPRSAMKIALLVLTVVMLIALVFYALHNRQPL